MMSSEERNVVTGNDAINAGYNLGKKLTDSYRAQLQHEDIYICGHRVHHGTVGALLVLFGGLAATLSKNDDLRAAGAFAVGLGVELMEDDIDDVMEWFAFKKQPLGFSYGTT